jgi:hypothetical protein
MKPGSRETIPTISEIVREATAICDPEGTDTAVIGLFESFEDDDRPATAAESEAVGLCADAAPAAPRRAEALPLRRVHVPAWSYGLRRRRQ